MGFFSFIRNTKIGKYIKLSMAHFNYTLQYRPASELLAEVKNDLSNYDVFGYIDSSQLIRVIIYKMYELGLRIYQNKDVVLEVKNHEVKLPDFFLAYNFGFICYDGVMLNYQGVLGKTMETVDVKDDPPIVYVDQNNVQQIGYVSLPPSNINTCSTSNQNFGLPAVGYMGDNKVVWFNECGGKYELIYKNNNYAVAYKRYIPLVLSNRYYDSNPLSKICSTCKFNVKPLDVGYNYPVKEYLEIRNGWAYLPNVKEATIYINYISLPYDDENKELLIPDNPIISQFLEYALKKKILENAVLNNNDVKAIQKLQLVEAGYREYMLKAHSLVNTPNFKEMMEVWRLNRKALEDKYFRINKINN